MIDPYKLSRAEHNRVYAEIEASHLLKSSAQERPHAIITGGQPGAGKSRITSNAKAELAQRGGAVLIDADKLRRYHRDYDSLLKADDTQAANRTHADAGAWAAELLRAGAAGQRNLIVDQTSKDPAALDNLAQRLHEKGYTVELRAMAVNERISEQRIHMRYETQKAVVGFGRFSTKDNHDHAYKMIPESVGFVEKNRSVDAIKLYDKDHQTVYSNRLENGEWVEPAKAREALETERSRPMSLNEKREYATGYEALARMVAAPDRQATAEQINAIDHLRKQANCELAAAIFKQVPPDEAIKQRPELAPAYAAMAAIDKRAEADGMTAAQRDHVAAQSRNSIAKSIERGDTLEVRINESVIAMRQQDTER